MEETYDVTMGDKGRIVIPAEVRERHGLGPGCEMVLIDYYDLADPEKVGLQLLTKEELLAAVRAEWKSAGRSLVDEVIRERRAEAARENAEMDAWVAAHRGCSLEEAEAWLRSQDEVWDAKEAASPTQHSDSSETDEQTQWTVS